MNASRDDIDLSALGRAIVRRRRWLIALPLVAGALCFLVLSLLTPQYSSEARLLIDNEETVYTRPAVVGDRAEVKRVDLAVVRNQVQVLTSRDLSSKVIERLGLTMKREFNPFIKDSGFLESITSVVLGAKKQSIQKREELVSKAFRERLEVAPVLESHVINVRFTSEDPELAATAANVLADEYVNWQRDAKLRVNKGASKWLSAEIEALRGKVKDAEAKVEKFRAQSGQQAGRNNVTLNAQQLSELNSQLIVAKTQRSEAEVRAKLLKDMLANKQDINGASDVLKSGLIQRLLEQRVSIQRTRSELSATLLSGHPRIKQLEAELKGLNRQIRSEVKKIVSSLTSEAQIAKAREQSLLQTLNSLKNQTANASDDTVKLRALQREAKANRDLLESYLARYRDASSRRDSDSVPANATIVSRAHPSSEPSFPLKLPMTILAMTATFLLTFGYVISAELINLTYGGGAVARSADTGGQQVEPKFGDGLSVRSMFDDETFEEQTRPVQQIERLSATTVTAETIESETLPGEDGPVYFEGPDEAAVYLIECAAGEGGYRVLLCGADEDVDTSEVVVALARAVAKKAKKVVVVDTSDGPRSVSGVVGVARAPGLRELVNGDAVFEDVIRRDQGSRVQIISSGNPRLSKKGADVKASWNRVFDALDKTYDLVFLHARYSAAKGVFQSMDADFDAGVVVARDGEGKKLADIDKQFLGLTVKGLEIVYLGSGLSSDNSFEEKDVKSAANG